MTRSFPEIITPRLLLRRLTVSDFDMLIRQVNDRKIADQLLNIPYPYSEDDAVKRLNFILEGFENGDRYVFVIVLREKGLLVGEIGLHLDKTNDHAQFGYWVGESFRGLKIATEATAALLRFGFEDLGLKKIYATHYPSNVVSGKVLSNNGMVREAELKDHYKVGEDFRTVIQYRLTREEFAALRR